MEKKGQSVRYLELSDLEKIRKYLEKNKYIVMLGLMNFSLNTGLRISDVKDLKFEDISNNSFEIKDNRKIKKIILNQVCMENIENLKKYYKECGINNYEKGYIFKSQSTKNHNKEMPITYDGIIYYIRKIKSNIEIPYPFGTDSFRKTWGRVVYGKTGDIHLLMSVFNHINPAKSLEFIGINENQISQFLKNETLI